MVGPRTQKHGRLKINNLTCWSHEIRSSTLGGRICAICLVEGIEDNKQDLTTHSSASEKQKIFIRNSREKRGVQVGARSGLCCVGHEGGEQKGAARPVARHPSSPCPASSLDSLEPLPPFVEFQQTSNSCLFMFNTFARCITISACCWLMIFSLIQLPCLLVDSVCFTFYQS